MCFFFSYKFIGDWLNCLKIQKVTKNIQSMRFEEIIAQSELKT